MQRIVDHDQGRCKRGGSGVRKGVGRERPNHDMRRRSTRQQAQLRSELCSAVLVGGTCAFHRSVDRWRTPDHHEDPQCPHHRNDTMQVATDSQHRPRAPIALHAHRLNLRYCAVVNAVERFAGSLAPQSLRRVAALESGRFEASTAVQRQAEPMDLHQAFRCVVGRFGGDLCGFLNVLTRSELAQVACAQVLVPSERSPELRVALWNRGAELERAGASVSPAVQPRPVVLGGHLCMLAPPRGLFPPSATWPRPMPMPVDPAAPNEEPETVDELLDAADRAIGVRLGQRGADKGAWGVRVASLLGVVERGGDEPDWRGDVELKTVPVAPDRASGLWRVVEDPAIAMVGNGRAALAKLQRTLWLARANCDHGDATIVSWYLLEWDAGLAPLVARYLHQRPKGPAGTKNRGAYLHKRFFADAGFLATLNGPL